MIYECIVSLGARDSCCSWLALNLLCVEQMMVKTFPHSECWDHRQGSPSLINRIYIYIKLNKDYGCFLFTFSYFQQLFTYLLDKNKARTHLFQNMQIIITKSNNVGGDVIILMN